MYQCCFICNTQAGNTLKNAVSLFSEHTTFTSGNKVSEVVSEIVGKPVQENNVHTNILCKKCCRICIEYDSIQVRLQTIKTELLDQFKSGLRSHKLDYENYGKSYQVSPSKPKIAVGKKLVLPASKLQPIPPDLLLKVGKLASFSKANTVLPQIKPTLSTLNLKVTVGSSVLTQTIKTSTPKSAEKQQESNNILTSITKSIKDDLDNIVTQSNENNSILTFNSNTLPKDFLAGAVLTKINDKNDDEKVEEANDDHPMEIDEDCLSVVPVTTAEGGNLVLKVEGMQSKSPSTTDVNEYSDVEIPPLSDDTDVQKYILGKLQILNDNDEDDDEGLVVVDSENGILRMVSGQKFIYEGGEISLVMPDDDGNDDGDGDNDGDQHDTGDSQDSNDESQIELQVSGDEETANAIIAAAQEQGGAFIKVETGEMFRVQSVSSTSTETPHISTLSQNIVVYENGEFKCLLCEKNEENPPSVGDADTMMRHLKSEHDARIYLCNICGAILRKRNDYTTHLALHTKKLRIPSRSQSYRCVTCNKSFGSRTLLQEHSNVHSGVRPYQCTVCHKAFASKYTYQAHLKTHAIRPRPFKCSQCGKLFLTQQNLNQHEKTHSGVKDFVCNICSKAFSTQHNLEVHGVVHSGNKAFVCGVCGKAFARRAELRDHDRIHTGERPFSCDVCGACFSQRSNLHSHRRATHLDDKRYHCTQCPKRFKRRRLLEYHIKASHTGERPLKCEFCPSSFVYPEHYKKHMRIHSGERPYVCEICGKSFNSRDNRNTHRFVHSDKKPYECVACGAGYMRKQLLYAHMNSSGHLAETIVVNQPRVIKVTENAANSQVDEINSIQSKISKFDTIFETNELDESVKSIDAEVNLEDAKFYITTDDKKLILQDSGNVLSINKLTQNEKATINLIQDGDDSTLLTIHNIGERGQSTILEAVDADQLAEQTEIVANDENGGMVRLIQIKLPDGNNGWVAINR